MLETIDMAFKKRELIKTIEFEGLTPKGKPELSLNARIEILKSDQGDYLCNVWFLESYKIVPTESVLQAQQNDSNPAPQELWCDKSFYAFEDALGFEELRGKSIVEIEKDIVRKLEELFT